MYIVCNVRFIIQQVVFFERFHQYEFGGSRLNNHIDTSRRNARSIRKLEPVQCAQSSCAWYSFISYRHPVMQQNFFSNFKTACDLYTRSCRPLTVLPTMFITSRFYAAAYYQNILSSFRTSINELFF